MTAVQARAVLALGDATPASDNAAWRAALVARDLGAPLRLLRFDAGGGAAAGAQLARDIRQAIGIPAQAEVPADDVLQQVVQAARGAQLLVLGTRRGNPLREFLLGTQAERLIRLCRIPVLVVKRPAAASYRRVLVPVDLGAGTGAVIGAAARLSRDPRMEVLHALDARRVVSLRVPDLPEAVLRRARGHMADGARSALLDLIRQAAPPEQGASPRVVFGDAAAAILARERALRADLVVIGKRTRGLLADFFLGSVTQRVLAAARADVLVLPRGARAVAGSGRRGDGQRQAACAPA